MDNILIVGAGGFGREVYQWAKDAFGSKNYHFKGFLSKNTHDFDAYNLKLPILGNPLTYTIESEDKFIFAIGDIDVKKRITTHLKANGGQCLTLIHPTALVADTASIGEGAVVCPFATVCDHAIIDEFVMMNFYSSCGHDAQVGKYSILSPYATLNGFARLEEEVFMGTHATVTAGTLVGRRSKINANSIAMRDVPPGSFVFGVPGKIKRIFHESES
jgi:sugar O-acyltransferase (sialic acid O-acetyltransferase NeuD family)